MEKFWNYFYYNLYKFEVKTSKFIKYPIDFIFDKGIYRLPFIKNRIERTQINSVIFEQIEQPMNMKFANIHIGGMLVLFEYSIFNFIQAILGKSLIQYIWENNVFKIIFIVGLLIIPYYINHYFLWKEDKYLKYFKKFDKEDKRMKRKWNFISLGIVLGFVGFFILSFYILTTSKR